MINFGKLTISVVVEEDLVDLLVLLSGRALANDAANGLVADRAARLVRLLRILPLDAERVCILKNDLLLDFSSIN